MRQPLVLTPEEVQLAREYGLTFSPRRKGKVVCNLPKGRRFGLLNPRQTETLRQQVWPWQRQIKSTIKYPAVILTVVQDQIHGVTCPYCQFYNDVSTPGFNECDFCHKVFRVKKRKPPKPTRGYLDRIHHR